MIVLASWAVGLVLGAISLSVDGPIGIAMFLIAGAILGSGLGGVQVADRVLMVRLSPPERVGEFFGLYGLVGKGSQVIGQLLYGLDAAVLLRRAGRWCVPARRADAPGHDAPRGLAPATRPRRTGTARARSTCTRHRSAWRRARRRSSRASPSLASPSLASQDLASPRAALAVSSPGQGSPGALASRAQRCDQRGTLAVLRPRAPDHSLIRRRRATTGPHLAPVRSAAEARPRVALGSSRRCS